MTQNISGQGGETKGDETNIGKIRKIGSHISFVGLNNFRQFQLRDIANKNNITKIK